jgi:hypothetical protein
MYASLSEAYNTVPYSPRLAGDLNSKYNRQYSPMKAPTPSPTYPNEASSTKPPAKEKFHPSLSEDAKNPQFTEYSKRDYKSYYEGSRPSPFNPGAPTAPSTRGQANQMGSPVEAYQREDALPFGSVDFKTIGVPQKKKQPVMGQHVLRKVPGGRGADASSGECISPEEVDAIVERRVKEELAKRQIDRIEKFTGLPPSIIHSLLLVLTGVFVIVSLDLVLSIVIKMRTR